MNEIRHDLIVVFITLEDYTKISLALKAHNTIHNEVGQTDEHKILIVPIAEINSLKRAVKLAKVGINEVLLK